MTKDPSAVAVRNGQFLGLQREFKDSKIALLPIPWDVTTSYRPGTVAGPQAVLEASYQLDLYSPYRDEVWNMPLHTLPIDQAWSEQSQKLRVKTQQYIDFLEDGGDLESSEEMQAILSEANQGCANLHRQTYAKAAELLGAGRRVLTLGGDHSVTLGPLMATADHFGQISVLHFDAHADLREAYEGFEDSHASIMFNVLKNKNIEKLVQVGIRDVSAFEIDLIKKDDRIQTHFDWDLQGAKAEGQSWNHICQRIVSGLGKNVYVSFDIDGLDPKLCPNTGTPVPGGLELFEATTLIRAVVDSGRRVVGADLVEVAPGDGNEWDGNVGARTLFQLALALWDGDRESFFEKEMKGRQ